MKNEVKRSYSYAVYNFAQHLVASTKDFGIDFFKRVLNLHLLEVVSYELASQQLTINVEVQFL
ncbi:hypothetical protein DC345_14365 [Paenibacillus taichungensis]|uniref:Uncharacterized protein n=1 Tax=Paenibacillus taichungensis TaxID=484184 RepID=A0A329QS53_9BACL|nr:hypothetical protein DC345_14365 [Paenibacillus taichungensis]